MTYTSPLVPEWECYHRQYPFFHPFPHASATKFNNEKPAHTSWGNHALISKLGKGAVQQPPHSLKMSRSKHDRKFNSREWVQHSWYKVLQSWCKCTNSMCPTHPNGELFCGTKIPSRRLFLFFFFFLMTASKKFWDKKKTILRFLFLSLEVIPRDTHYTFSCFNTSVICYSKCRLSHRQW